jgi:acetyltransferase-like isoleucine patch superfamily enzyme
VSHSVFLHCERRIDVEDLVGLAERVTVVDSTHKLDGGEVNWRDQPIEYAPVRIGRNTTVFANALVLYGASIGANGMVAANAVVGAGEYPDSWILAGQPAKPVKPLPRANG